MSQLSQAVSSPLNEASVSPLLWGTTTTSSPANNNILSRSSTRSTPIAIVRNSQDDADIDSDDDDDDVVHSFQQLVLETNQTDDGQFCVGSLPTRQRRNRHSSHKKQLGTSLPAAPILRSTRRRTPTIPPMTLTEGQEESASPSYGSLRESQLAGRFLDGPSSYREKSSGQIKKWSTSHSSQHKVRFQSGGSTPGERMQELRKTKSTTPEMSSSKDEPPSSLSAIMSGTQVPQSSFVDHDYSLHQEEDVLSTSLTGLELLQRGLTAGIRDQPPEAANLSSWSSSGANTYDAVVAEQQQAPSEEAHDSVDHNNMFPLQDDDDSPVFDLDME